MRSPGVLAASLGELTVLYDLVTEMAHVLNPSAAVLWASCDGSRDRNALVAELAQAVRADPTHVQGDLDAGLARLSQAGLVGRSVPAPAPPVLEITQVTGAVSSTVFAVLDDGVMLRGDDAALLASVDSLLVSLADERAATVELGVATADDGSVHLSGRGTERAYGSVEAFLDALPTALNQIAAATSSCLVLHAGCVRAPDGEVVLLPAVSGSGKTTLTAALVQAGWAYGTDEAVGVRSASLEAVTYPKPLVLDGNSREVLGLSPSISHNTVPTELRAEVGVLVGTAGPVGRVVLPRYETGAAVSLSEPLSSREAIIALLEHAINLARVGQPGLEVLCQLAGQVRVQVLVHGGVADAVSVLTGSPSHAAG